MSLWLMLILIFLLLYLIYLLASLVKKTEKYTEVKTESLAKKKMQQIRQSFMPLYRATRIFVTATCVIMTWKYFNPEGAVKMFYVTVGGISIAIVVDWGIEWIKKFKKRKIK